MGSKWCEKLVKIKGFGEYWVEPVMRKKAYVYAGLRDMGQGMESPVVTHEGVGPVSLLAVLRGT
jgi:hypothetical protein